MTKHLKVIHCIGSAHIGGIERLIIDLAIQQQQMSVEVAVLLNSLEGPYLNDLNSHHIPVYESKYSSGIDLSLKKRKKVKELFRNFDIVHMHVFNVNYFLAARKARKKIVYTIHGLSKGVKKGNFLKMFLLEQSKKIYLNKVDYFLANSDFTLSGAVEHYGLAKVRKKVVLNAVNDAETESVEQTKTNNIFTVGVVSRFIERKRIDKAVTTFKQFLDIGGKGKLILVGNGPTFANVENLIKKLGLAMNVEMKGYQSKTKDLYRSFDVCIAPAKNEPFGLVAVESYLAGKPNLVFSDSGGLLEIIESFEKNDIASSSEDMAKRLLFYYQNLNELLANASKRRAYALTQFGMPRMALDYLNLYYVALAE